MAQHHNFDEGCYIPVSFPGGFQSSIPVKSVQEPNKIFNANVPFSDLFIHTLKIARSQVLNDFDDEGKRQR